MRLARWVWGASCALALVTACAEPEQSTESAKDVASPLASASASASAPNVLAKPGAAPRPNIVHRSRQDPNAKTHATGRRALDAKEQALVAANARKVTGVRPTALLVDRLRDEYAEKTPSASSASKLSELEAAVVPFGDDLITVGPGESARASAASTLETLPRSADNSALPAFPEIRNQENLNSCVAFAVGYYQYTYSLGRIAGWNNKNTINTTKVSPKWLYNLVNQGEDQGTHGWAVHRILEEHGAVTWSEFPYVGNPSNPVNYREWPRTTATWKNALKYKSTGYAYVGAPTNPTALSHVKSLLANGQVLTFGTFIYSWEFEQIDDDPSTSADNALVGQNIATWMNGYAGLHEATLVGYNDDIWVDINANGSVESGEKGAFKIANSWGPTWQNAGYAWVAYDALQWQSQVPNGPSSELRSEIMVQVTALVGARANYQPNLVAEFTASTASRGKLYLFAGLTELDRTDVVARWNPAAFHFTGGDFAYDGTTTTTAKSGSFALDLTGLALSYGDLKYRLQGQNSAHTASTLSGFSLVDRLRNNTRTTTTDPTVTIGENETKAQSIRYKFQDATRVPQLTVTPASSVAFGSVTLGQSVERSVTVTNTGTGDLLVTSLRFTNPLFLTNSTSSFRLLPGASSVIDLEFAPAATQAETGTLSIRNTSANLAAPSLALTGSATSTNDSAPYQLFITQQNDPRDNSISLRAELKSRVSTPTALSDYQVVYFVNDPGVDPATMQWGTTYTNVGPISASASKLPLAPTLGTRKADTSITFRFAPGTTLPAGASAIFQGSLHRADYGWYPNETDDWSRYLRSNGMAEGTIIQEIATENVVFGLAAVGLPGAYQLSFTPNPVTTELFGTAHYTVNKPNQLGTEFFINIYSSSGELVDTRSTYPSTLGVHDELFVVENLSPGRYTVLLETGGNRVDSAEFEKQ